MAENISYPDQTIVPRMFRKDGRLDGESSWRTGRSFSHSSVTSFLPPLIVRMGKAACPILTWLVKSRGFSFSAGATGTPRTKALCRTGEMRLRSCFFRGDTDRAYMREVRTISPATMYGGFSRNMSDPGGSGCGPP